MRRALFETGHSLRWVTCGFATLLAVFASRSPVGAQQASALSRMQNIQREPGFRLRVQKNLVVVRAVVRDSHGHPVDRLREDDFRILDNHKRQAISSFSVQTAAGAPPTPPRSASVTAPAHVARQRQEEQRHAPEPLTYLVLYFDDLNSSFDSLARARVAAEKFIAELPATEQIAIFTSSGGQNLDFTDDRAALHQTLGKLRDSSLRNPMSDCPQITDYLAGQIVNLEDPDAYEIVRDEAINDCSEDPNSVTKEILRMLAQAAFDTYMMRDRADLDNLEGVVERLALMPGERQVLLVSDGFIPLEMRDRVEKIIDRALHSQVIISALDAKGLAVRLREADASEHYAPGGNLQGLYRIYDDNREADATGTLAEIADGTGGEFFHNNNDLLDGFRRVLAPPEVTYILTFSPQNLKPNGAFHTLKVQLVNGHGMTVQARKGYFAPVGEQSGDKRAEEQIREAVFSPNPL